MSSKQRLRYTDDEPPVPPFRSCNRLIEAKASRFA
jgi:hypothetical protein